MGAGGGGGTMKLILFEDCWSLTIDEDEVSDFVYMVSTARESHYVRDLQNEVKRVIK